MPPLLPVRHIDFGTADAESDSRLDSAFVVTPYVISVINGQGTLLLGRQGSGKTALWKLLPDLMPPFYKRPLIYIPMTLDDYSWSELRSFDLPGLPSETAHTSSWKLTLAIRIASELAIHQRKWGHDARAAIGRIQRFLGENFEQNRLSVGSIVKRLRSGVDTLAVSAFGSGITVKLATHAELDPRQANKHLYDGLDQQLSACLDEVGIVMHIDRLDEWWDGSQQSQSVVIGLLRAAKELNDRFRFNNELGLRAIVFLRTDIYSTLRFDHKNKHHSSELLLNWTPGDLRQMIEARLPGGASTTTLFDRKPMPDNSSPLDYVLQRTFLRPRDVLQYLHEAVKQVRDQSTYLSRDCILRAERRYSRWKVDDLKQEFRNVYPAIDQALEGLRDGPSGYESLSLLMERVFSRIRGLSSRIERHVLRDTLFESSVIGRRVAGSQAVVQFKCDDPDLPLPLEVAPVFVHPALWQGLDIVDIYESRTLEPERQGTRATARNSDR